MPDDQQGLFPELQPARNGNGRKGQRLFIPKLLTDEAARKLHGLSDTADQAHAIFVKWADLETSGKLAGKTEKTLHGEFLADVMSKALGYTVFSGGQENWDLEAEFAVAGGHADAAIGLFATNDRPPPRVLVELKGPTCNIDRDRSSGRTPVQQAWDYLNDVPQCPWAIVCNLVSFRLYHRTKTTRTYEHFTLQDLRDKTKFREFYCLFERGGFLPALAGQKPRCDDLLERSENQQRDVGGKLYSLYHDQRTSLIHHLRQPPHKLSLDEAIHVAQKLLDRIIFIAFCEDRRLLPSGIIEYAWNVSTGLAEVDNPRWRSFLGLFKKIDQGDSKQHITGYNGELFKPDVLINKLELNDERTDFFREIAAYNFDVEVNVDILGHLFEQSISDLELLRQNPDEPPTQARRAIEGHSKQPGRRKREGVYYTPPYITKYIVSQAIGNCLKEHFAALAAERKLDLATPPAKRTGKKWAAYHEGRYDILKGLRVCDPACGSGAFLIEAFDFLEGAYEEVIGDLIALEVCGEQELDQINPTILQENLFGVDLSDEAVGITKLALWIRTAEIGRPLSNLSNNIKAGNSVVNDQAVHAAAFDWQAGFPEVFAAGGFDVVIGNPPYIRQEWLAPYKEHWETAFRSYDGVADIFTYFFERGLEVLRPGGRLAYITSGSWVRGNYGAPLRKYLTETAAVDSMIDFGEFQPFEDAEMIRPSITILRKGGERQPMRLYKWLVAGKPSEDLGSLIAAAPTMRTDHLGEEAWELESDDVIALRKKLSAGGMPLTQYVEGGILRGVLTGLTEVFVIDSERKERLIRKHASSAELIKPFVQGTHIRPWYVEESGEFLITIPSSANHEWPWSDSGDKAEKVFAKQFPAIHEYLSEHRESAMTRGDKGRYWWELRACAYWEAFTKPKIVWSDISKLPRFSIDSKLLYLGNTVYTIPVEDYYLLGILSSWATWYFISKTAQPLRLRGDRWQFRLFTQFMEQVPIPSAKKPERTAIAALAKKCCEIGADRYERQTKVQRRLAQGFGEGVGGIALGKLNEKAQEWWETSLGDLGAALKTSFKLAANPFKNPKTADEWDAYLSENRREVERLTRELAAAESEINDRVYRLFQLTPDEIKLLQREVEH